MANHPTKASDSNPALPNRTALRNTLSLAEMVIIGAAMTVPVDAAAVILEDAGAANAAGAVHGGMSNGDGVDGRSGCGGGVQTGATPASPVPCLDEELLIAQSSGPPIPPFDGTIVCEGAEGGCVGIDFPRPGDVDTVPEEGGVPPQVRSPVLTTPDLLLTKPRVAPDLEGRFSNGGNEEIW